MPSAISISNMPCFKKLQSLNVIVLTPREEREDEYNVISMLKKESQRRILTAWWRRQE